MKENRVTLTLEGIPKYDGHVRLAHFIDSLANFSAMVFALDRQLSHSSTPTFFFQIAGLHSSNPAIILEAVPKDPDADNTIPVLRSCLRLVEGTAKRQLDRPVDPIVLDHLSKLSAPVGGRLRSIRISTMGQEHTIDREFKASLEGLLAPESKLFGFMRGVLEFMNIHAGRRLFRIYPSIGPRFVNCNFDDEMLGRAVSAIGKHIEVRGVVHYRYISQYPHEIDVSALDVLPDDSDLPTIDKLLGAAKGLTGAMSSEEFVRSLRDED